MPTADCSPTAHLKIWESWVSGHVCLLNPTQPLPRLEVLCVPPPPGPHTVLEWEKANGGPQSYTPAEDPGVVACRRMYAYFRKHGHDTICMPASWRSSTGNDPLDEVCAGCGVGWVEMGAFVRAWARAWATRRAGTLATQDQDKRGGGACARQGGRAGGHGTICMPACWRSSTGNDPLDEVRAGCGAGWTEMCACVRGHACVSLVGG